VRELILVVEAHCVTDVDGHRRGSEGRVLDRDLLISGVCPEREQRATTQDDEHGPAHGAE